MPVHGVRSVSELAYSDRIRSELPSNEYFGDQMSDRLIYYLNVMREPYLNRGRLTDHIDSGRLFEDIGLAPLDPVVDRAMVCGSPTMLADACKRLDLRGFRISPHIGVPGDDVSWLILSASHESARPGDIEQVIPRPDGTQLGGRLCCQPNLDSEGNGYPELWVNHAFGHQATKLRPGTSPRTSSAWR